MKISRKKTYDGLLCTILVVVLSIFSSCIEGNDSSIHSAELGDTLRLSVTDSIGISAGDSNYVFGEIIAMRDNPAGQILVLDDVKDQVLKYDVDGTFLQGISRPGFGPGELLNPIDFDIDSSGNIVILDMMRGEIFSLSDTGEFISTIEEYSDMPPLKFDLVADSRYTSMSIEQEFCENGELSILTSVLSSDPSNDEMIEHWSLVTPVDPARIENLYYCSILAITYDVDSQGNLYYATAENDRFHLVSHDPCGNLRWEIEYTEEQQEKNSTELQEEQERIRCLAGRFGGRVDNPFDPPPFRVVIEDIDVDAFDRIWVRNGLEQEPVFDLYSSSGEHLLTIVADIPYGDNSVEWDFEIDNSISCFAINPADYPRILCYGDAGIGL